MRSYLVSAWWSSLRSDLPQQSGPLSVDQFSTDHSSAVGCLGALRFGSQHSLASQVLSVFFNRLLFLQCDSTRRASLLSLVLSVSFPQHGSPWYGFLSARFSSLSSFGSNRGSAVAAPITASTRQAHMARSRGDSMPHLRGWGSIFVLHQWLGIRFAVGAPYLICGRGPVRVSGPRLGSHPWAASPQVGLHLCSPGSEAEVVLRSIEPLRSVESQGEWPRTRAQGF